MQGQVSKRLRRLENPPLRRRRIIRSRVSLLIHSNYFFTFHNKGWTSVNTFEALSTRHSPIVITGLAPLTRASKKLEARGNSLVYRRKFYTPTSVASRSGMRRAILGDSICLLSPSRLQMTRPAASLPTQIAPTTLYTLPPAATPPPSTSVLGKHGHGSDTSSETGDRKDD